MGKEMMDETLDYIQKLANERIELWRLAGKQRLTPDQQARIDEITGRLPLLWDQHRRELAAARWAKPVPRAFERSRAA